MSEKMNPLDFLADQYVICICEGTAEEVIMETLLDNDCLMFNRRNLVDRDVTRIRTADKIQSRFLNREFSKPVSIIRILDSRSERFRLGKLYQQRFSIYPIYTRPEIEMLMVLAENQYQAFRKSKKKPSDFMAGYLPHSHIKARSFLQTYYSDVDKLLHAIHLYSLDAGHKGEYSLYHLLKDEYRNI